MYADDATFESPKLNLPEELLAEVSRRAAAAQGDFRVDGWKPSLPERLVKLFGLSCSACDRAGSTVVAGRSAAACAGASLSASRRGTVSLNEPRPRPARSST